MTNVAPDYRRKEKDDIHRTLSRKKEKSRSRISTLEKRRREPGKNYF